MGHSHCHGCIGSIEISAYDYFTFGNGAPRGKRLGDNTINVDVSRVSQIGPRRNCQISPIAGYVAYGTAGQTIHVE